jgi:hypothetical protein
MRLAPVAVALLSLTGVAVGARRARADDLPLVHPIYAQLPDLPENEITRRAFAAAAARYKLSPLEIVDIPAPMPPAAPATLKASIGKTLKLAFDEALPELDADATEVAATGGAGLSSAELSDLYLYRAMARARADWKAPAASADADHDAARVRAFDDYVRAAALAPTRALNPRELPPQVIADFARAAEELRKRPRATVVVTGDADAEVSLDGAPATPVSGGVTFHDVSYGEHVLHVDELGRAPWGTSLTVAAPTMNEQIPPRAALSLDDAVAAAHARRMGTRFALVAERKPGPRAEVELRLVDLDGKKRDAALVSTTNDERGAIDAAVMRLDEQARRIVELEVAAGTPPPVASPAPPPDATPLVLLPAPPAKATLQSDPAAWARDHWPLLTAAGVVVVSALVLTIAANH